MFPGARTVGFRYQPCAQIHCSYAFYFFHKQFLSCIITIGGNLKCEGKHKCQQGVCGGHYRLYSCMLDLLLSPALIATVTLPDKKRYYHRKKWDKEHSGNLEKKRNGHNRGALLINYE